MHIRSFVRRGGEAAVHHLWEPSTTAATSQTERVRAGEGESFAVGCHLYVGWDRDRGQGIAPYGKKVQIPSLKLILPERDFCPVS